MGEKPSDLVPVVLAALDRVAKQQEPETFGVFCTTASWWLMDRLRRLGFTVHWPAWVMSSVPLPGLDRYLPTYNGGMGQLASDAARKLLAVAVLVVAAYVLFKLVLGFVAAIAWLVIAVVAVVAVVWALRVL